MLLFILLVLSTRRQPVVALLYADLSCTIGSVTDNFQPKLDRA